MLKKNVMIIVDSKKEQPDREAEEMKFMTEGIYCKKGGHYFISYAESPVTGLDGTNTIIKIEPDSIMLIRSGTASSLMFFKKGCKHTSGCDTGNGIVEFGVTALNLNVSLDEKGGQFHVEYVLEVNNRLQSLTTLNVKVY
ncbi:MAG TPA: DUF1934 domain-containing protein [Ruminiclostridium sp.]|jgi:uncharacterized beta-barrel protein YwiB (DUF1934 family)|nr:DUF1934 domain-containing protein [Clostridiaceae bacterium]HAA25786.1 DUF1934 domain-containing protein [Ruminiclostridium sp.]